MGFTHDWDDLISKKRVRVAGLNKPPVLGGPVRRFFGQAPMGATLDRDRADSYEYPQDIKVLDPERDTGWLAAVKRFGQNRLDYHRLAQMWRKQQAELRERHEQGKPLPPGFAGKEDPGKPSDYIWRPGSPEGVARKLGMDIPVGAHDQFKIYTDKGHHNLGNLGQKGPLLTRLNMMVNRWLSFIPGIRDPTLRNRAKRKQQHYADAMHILTNHSMQQMVDPSARMHPEDLQVVHGFLSDFFQQHHGMSKQKADLHSRGVSKLADVGLHHLQTVMNEVAQDAMASNPNMDPEEILGEIMGEDGLRNVAAETETRIRNQGRSSIRDPEFVAEEFSADNEEEGEGGHPIDYDLPEPFKDGTKPYDPKTCDFGRFLGGEKVTHPNNAGGATPLDMGGLKVLRGALMRHKRDAHGNVNSHTPGAKTIDENQDPYEWLLDENGGFNTHLNSSSTAKRYKNRIIGHINTLRTQGPEALNPMLGYLLGNEDHLAELKEAHAETLPNFDPAQPHTYFHPPDAPVPDNPVDRIDVRRDDEDPLFGTSYDEPIDLAWGILKGV